MLSKEETKPQYKIFDTIVSLPVIRILKPLYEWKRSFWIYCVLGFLSVVTDTVLSVVLNKILASGTVSNVLAWMASTLVSFVLYRYFYFDRTNNSFMNEFMKFVPSRLFTLGVSTLAIFILVDTMGFNMLLIKIILIPIIAGLNYLTSKFFVFKEKA